MKSKQKYLPSADGDSLQIQVPNLSTLQSASLSFTSGDRVNFSVSANNLEQAESGRRQCKTLESKELLSREVMDGGGDPGSCRKFSVPNLLRKVWNAESFNDIDNNYYHGHDLLVIAVHAAFIESGLILIDSASGSQIRFSVPKVWPFCAFSIRYTLPKLLVSSSKNAVESIDLRFQSCNHFINVYGCLNGDDPHICHLGLDQNRFAPSLNLAWEDCAWNENDPVEKTLEVFWRRVKDGLVLPLLIGLCEKTGMKPPSCLINLPKELQVMILELLPGIDLARMGRVCKEMLVPCSRNELWKKKFKEEFSDQSNNNKKKRKAGQGGAKIVFVGNKNWKEQFGLHWKLKTEEAKRRGIQRYLPPGWRVKILRSYMRHHLSMIRTC